MNMKRIIAIITIITSVILVFSCAISSPNWIDYGQEGVYIEYCRDTITHDELDSVLASHKINPNWNEWSVIKYYEPDYDEMTQFTFTSSDTTYTINKTRSTYIFTARCLNN